MSGRRHARLAARQAQRRQVRRRLFIGAGALLVAAAVAVGAVTVPGWLRDRGGAHPVDPSATSAARTQATLLVQLAGADGDARASVLLAADPAVHTGAMVLVPSRLVAPIPGSGPGPFGSALRLGSPSAPAVALSDVLGVTVDGSWVLDGAAFGRLVDAVGGVDVTVDTDVVHTAADGTRKILVGAGAQRLEGAAAVAFATYQEPDALELTMLARFGAVLAGVAHALPDDPAQLARLIENVGGGSTSTMATPSLAALLGALHDVAVAKTLQSRILPVTSIDTGDVEPAYGADSAKVASMVAELLAASVPEAQKRTGNRVRVENRVGTVGITETTRAKLDAAGFVYLPGGNAVDFPNPSLPSTVLIFDTSPESIARGYAVADALRLPHADVKTSTEGQTKADVFVIIGNDYVP